jgi:alpha-L-fucosidase
VKIARDAGAKYLVFTAKHHDGFSNFDSKSTNYKITSPSSPFRRDIVRELADACRKQDVMFGIYYSQRDWCSPDFMAGNYRAHAVQIHKQLEELCTNYGPIGEIWFDATAFGAKQWDAENLFKLIRKRQPNALINDRCGLPGDFATPERKVGGFDRRRLWESCIQLGTQWSWKPDDNIKSLKDCLEALIRCAGGDGNLLLNVGPMPDGRIEPRQADRLREIGAWLKDNGQAIYGTRGGPFKPGNWGASTCKADKIYLFILNWPKDGPLVMAAIGRKITNARLLTGGPVTVKLNDVTTIDVPRGQRQDIATVVELTIEGKALDITPVEPGPSPSATPMLKLRGLKSNHASRRDNGSAKTLKGAVCIYNIFVTDKASSWSQKEIADVRKRMKKAEDFLASQARRYGVRVSFKEVTADPVNYPKELPADPFVPPGWIEDVVRQASGMSGNRLVAFVKEKQKADHVAILLHVNKSATSYNLSYYGNVDPTYAAERAVLFNSYANGFPTAAASYAHEILHVFGAGELYFPFDKEDDRKGIAKRFWPNEIMHVVEYDLDRLMIGEYTAYRIGWLEQLKPEHRVFEDEG